MAENSALSKTRQKALLKSLFDNLEEASTKLANNDMENVHLKELSQIMMIFDRCQDVLKEIEPVKKATVKKDIHYDLGKFRLDLAERLNALAANASLGAIERQGTSHLVGGLGAVGAERPTS
jgi:hypothetical protein